MDPVEIVVGRGVMLEIVVVAILVVAVVGGAVLSAGEKEAVSRTWPVIRAESSRSEPAEEGAPVPGREAHLPGVELPKAA